VGDAKTHAWRPNNIAEQFSPEKRCGKCQLVAGELT
jgi:hypothetical protein